MNNFWKKFGWLCLAFLPLIASLLLQIILGIVIMLPISIVKGVELGLQGVVDPAAIENVLNDVIVDASAIATLAYHVLSIPIFGVWYYFGCGRPKAVSVRKVLSIKDIIIVTIGGASLCLFANGFMLFMQFVAPKVVEQYIKIMEMAGMGTNVLTIIAAVLLAPIGEEILCRGLIFFYARKVTLGMKNKTAAFWIANTIQALIFGIMHMNILQGSYAFVLGLGIGLLYKKYNSLYPCILAHFVVNFLSTFVIGFVLEPLPATIITSIVLMLISFAVFYVAVNFERIMRNNVDKTELE